MSKQLLGLLAALHNRNGALAVAPSESLEEGLPAPFCGKAVGVPAAHQQSPETQLRHHREPHRLALKRDRKAGWWLTKASA